MLDRDPKTECYVKRKVRCKTYKKTDQLRDERVDGIKTVPRELWYRTIPTAALVTRDVKCQPFFSL